MGSIFKHGRVYWIKYYAQGTPIRENTRTDSHEAARQILKEREGRVGRGEPVLVRVDRVTYDEARDDLKRHYATTGERGAGESQRRFAHLDAFFAGRRLITISGADVTAYVAKRQAANAANGTINRELGVLGKLLRLAYKHNKLARVPAFSYLKEAAPRQGFFEAEQFEAVRRRLSEDLRVVVTIAHTFGWRVPSEVLTLERRQLDLKAGTLRLDPGATKNDDGRVVYLTPELKAMLTAQVARVDALQRTLGRIVPWLFPHLTSPCKKAGCTRNHGHVGERRTKLRKVWISACKAAGVPGRIAHDFRRTAVRNLERWGVPRSVAMKITGHRTEAVYRRYAIVSDADLQEAARKLTGTIPGTNAGPGAILTARETIKSGS
jgi:integrase